RLRRRPSRARGEPAHDQAGRHPRPGTPDLEAQEEQEGREEPGCRGRSRHAGGPAVMTIAPKSFYEEVGGYATFERIVDVFYRGVAEDPVLKPMYPEEDLGPAAERLTWFLVQYWGGPTTYGERRGHPRLRMRHMPFHVDPDARDRWLKHMRTAFDEVAPSP